MTARPLKILKKLTVRLVETYKGVSPDFQAPESRAHQFLLEDNEGVLNDEWDNQSHDLIVFSGQKIVSDKS